GWHGTGDTARRESQDPGAGGRARARSGCPSCGVWRRRSREPPFLAGELGQAEIRDPIHGPPVSEFAGDVLEQALLDHLLDGLAYVVGFYVGAKLQSEDRSIGLAGHGVSS